MYQPVIVCGPVAATLMCRGGKPLYTRKNINSCVFPRRYLFGCTYTLGNWPTLIRYPHVISFPSESVLQFNTLVPKLSRATMLNLSSRTVNALRALVKGMATAAPRIGDTKVPMSLLEKGAYINYQRIEDNLLVVRDRYLAFFFISFKLSL